jgi:hypothetical protein
MDSDMCTVSDFSVVLFLSKSQLRTFNDEFKQNFLFESKDEKLLLKRYLIKEIESVLAELPSTMIGDYS